MREIKDSGIDWIGQIPNDWDIKKISSIYSVRNEKVSDVDYQPLSVTMKGIVTQLETAAKTDAHDDRKLVKKGDFAINSRSDRRGSCGISDRDGSVSLINTVLIPRDEMDPIFYNFLFHSSEFADEFYRWGHGIVDDLWTTRWQEMRNIFIPVPDLDEQHVIASYLEKKCSHIDSLISNQEQHIEKLKQYKQSLITETVTKGLNPNVAMKDSGVEWIEKIPEKWSVFPLKLSFEFGKGLPITKADLVPEGIKVISYGQIHAKYNSAVKIDNRLYRFVDEKYLGGNSSSLVKKNDMIFADTSEDVDGAGNFVFVDNDDTIFAGYHTVILKSLRNKDNKYLAFLFMSKLWKNQIQSLVKGIKVFSITKTIMSNATYILPPDNEQKLIAEYLGVKCEKIDRLIEIKQHKIEKLQEYKKSIIYEYVTGKKEL